MKTPEDWNRELHDRLLRQGADDATMAVYLNVAGIIAAAQRDAIEAAADKFNDEVEEMVTDSSSDHAWWFHDRMTEAVAAVRALAPKVTP